MFPSWHDAVTEMSVSSSVQEQIQGVVRPRLDSFAERLGEVMASAQSEMRELEGIVSRSEARVENRLSGLEVRLAALADGAARTEQRERDMNIRIAGIAEDLLRHADRDVLEASLNVRLEELSRKSQEESIRLKALEESCRRRNRTVDNKIERLEERGGVLPKFADDLREVAAATARSAVAAACPNSGQQHAVHSASEQLMRVAALEEQVRMLSCAVGAGNGVVGSQAFAGEIADTTRKIHAQVISSQEEHRQALSNQLMESTSELRAQVSAKLEEYKEAMSTRINDLNMSLGALKVKADGLDSRLHSGLDRVERAIIDIRDPEAAKKPVDLEEQAVKSFRQLSSDIIMRLEAVTSRVDNLEVATEEAEVKRRTWSRRPGVQAEKAEVEEPKRSWRTPISSRPQLERGASDKADSSKACSKCGGTPMRPTLLPRSMLDNIAYTP